MEIASGFMPGYKADCEEGNMQRRTARMNRIVWGLATAVVVFLVLASCATTPTTFTRGEADWSVIELRDEIDYDTAWEEIVDVIARRFDVEMVEKGSGYLRTSWIYTWWKSGVHTENYRVRAILKFTPEKDALAIKTDAHYMDRLSGGWVTGADSLLLDTLKTDIMGTVGRTTR